MTTEKIAAARALVPESFRTAGALKVSASHIYPPHSYFKDGTEELIGYEIELMQKVGEILDLRIDFTPIPWLTMIESVNSGSYDVSLGDLGNTDVRQEIIDFVCHSALQFDLMVADEDKGKVNSIYDLCGRKLSTVKGTFNVIEPALRAGCGTMGRPDATYVVFNNDDERREAIRKGEVSGSDSAAAGLARYRVKVGLAENLTLLPSTEMGDLYLGYLVSKANPSLSKAIAAALEILFADGTYAAILAKYDVSDFAIPAPGVNIGHKAAYFVQSAA
ncbi:MAG: transporter substrate-binding domain-containing protein [Devosia sp.]